MLFIYLLAISLVAMAIITVIDYGNSKKTLLQNIKKSCSIDSVQFENTLRYLNRLRYAIYTKSLSFVTKLVKNIEIMFDYYFVSKAIHYIRRKFHPEAKREKASVYIEKMKED